MNADQNMPMNTNRTFTPLTWPPLHPSRHRLGLLGGLAKLLNLALLTSVLSTPALAGIRNWTGAASGNWSNPNNWNPTGIPQNGEVLSFDNDSNITMINDIPNLSVADLELFDYDYVLNGNPLTLTGRPSNGSYPLNPGLLVKYNSSHTVTINCALILGGDVSFDAGDSPDVFPDMQLHVMADVNLNGHTLLFHVEGAGGGHIEMAGSISGQGDVEVEALDAGGTLDFDGTAQNTFTGALIFPYANGVIVSLNKQFASVVTNRLELFGGYPLNINHPGQIGSNATVVISQGSKLFLNGYDYTIGTLLITNVHADAQASLLDTGGGQLTLLHDVIGYVDNISVVPTIKGVVQLPAGDHSFNVDGFDYAGLDVQAQVMGTGGFTKSGHKALILEGSNSLSGPITVNQGILDVRNNYALGNAQSVTLTAGGSLTLRNSSPAGVPLIVNGNQPLLPETAGSLLFTVGTCVWGGAITLNTNLVVEADNTYLTGPISGPGGLDARGNYLGLAGPSANTFGGLLRGGCTLLELAKSSGTAFRGPLIAGLGVNTGTLETRWSGNSQGFSPTVTLYSDGLCNLNNHNDTFGPVAFNGGEIETGSGQLTVNQSITGNVANVTATIGGNLALGSSGTFPFNIADGAADPDLLINAAISGAPAQVQKLGAGTMTLTGINSYTGLTLVSQGILEADTGSSLGNVNPGNNVQVQSNATCRLAGSSSTSKGFLLSGSGTAGTNGALEFAANSSYTLTSSLLLLSPATIGVEQSAGAALNGVINGTGPLSKTGAGILTFGGGSANGYTGDTIILNGTFYLSKPALVSAVPGNLVIGPAPPSSFATAVLLQSAEIGGDTVTVDANATFNLNGFNQTLNRLNLNDGGSAQTGAGTLSFSGSGTVTVGSLSLLGSRVGSSISGFIGLPANDTLTFSVNRFNVISVPAPTGAELDVPASIPSPIENISFSPAGIAKTGSGQMHLSANNSYKGATIISAGTLRVDGSQPRTTVFVDGGTLSGIGTVGNLYPEGGSAIVSPGASPGILTCSNFNAGVSGPGTLQIELNGTTAGSGYDQLNVHGTVNLAGITLNPVLGYASAVGDQYTIINNDGSDAVTGSFTGLPQGKKLYIGQELFQISYTGGSGNDVVLARLTTPPPPKLTIERILPASVRLLWPTNDPSFSLQTATNVAAASWTNALPLPVVSGTNNLATNSITDTPRFYRLSNP
jgi:fibronectin-binding autotransporter adhesin